MSLLQLFQVIAIDKKKIDIFTIKYIHENCSVFLTVGVLSTIYCHITYRVNSGKFGHQVNSDTHLQAV